MQEEEKNSNKYPSRFGEISKKAKRAGRIIAFLAREQMDFIDKVGKDALFSTGKKLSRSSTIQSLVEAVRNLNVTGDDVYSPADLETKMHEVLKKTLSDISEQIKKKAGEE